MLLIVVVVALCGGFGANGYFLMGKKNRYAGPITWEKEGDSGIKDNQIISINNPGRETTYPFVEYYS